MAYKKILTIQDISCLGKCSLTVALPIISAMGVECAVVPTAVLSTHTMFRGYTFRDLTEDIDGILHHWKSLNVKFDYIVSGYLGSISQIDLVAFIKDNFLAENGKFIVDPVMGDDGKLYSACFPELVAEMRDNPRVCKYADIPVQHISDKVLASMNRHGDGATIRDAINRIRKEIPDVTLRSTAIVGFPGETDDDFTELCEKDFII